MEQYLLYFITSVFAIVCLYMNYITISEWMLGRKIKQVFSSVPETPLGPSVRKSPRMKQKKSLDEIRDLLHAKTI